MKYKEMVDRFVNYTTYSTASKPDMGVIPSTPGQMELAKVVAEDLKNAGIKDVELSDQAYIFATIPENIPDGNPAKGKVPIIAFLSHLDTAEEASGENVKARLIENYDGSDITYSAKPELTLNATVAPLLKDCIGHTIITSDGTTLLGGDDKAGLSILVQLAKHLTENQDIHHGKIRIAIMPDEEITVGAEALELSAIGADVAYTIDAAAMGEIDIESFNGFKGRLSVEGYPAFPGYGKDIYINAIQIISKFVARMNDERWPQNCDGRQPIWWVQDMNGTVSNANATVYMRDFDLDGIEEQKKLLGNIKDELQKEFPKSKINLDIEKMYLNYKYELDKDPRVVDYAMEAVERIGMKPRKNSVRGGNDCCRLCFKGLLSTNIFAGFENMHSVMEWVSVETMEKSFETIVEITKVWMEKSSK